MFCITIGRTYVKVIIFYYFKYLIRRFNRKYNAEHNRRNNFLFGVQLYRFIADHFLELPFFGMFFFQVLLLEKPIVKK